MQQDIQVISGSSTLSDSAHKVLRNTYMMLGLTMIPTVIGAFMGININFSFMAAHPIMAPLIMLAVVFGGFWFVAANRNNAIGVVALLGLTFIFGLLLGPILQMALHFRNGAQLVGMAAGGTGIIFMSLAGIATVTKKDFSFLGTFLFAGLILVIIASLANMFLQIPALHLALSAVSILIFSGYILFDVSRIIHGGETNYIMATLSIYLDIYNIFVNLLTLLMALAGDRR